MVNFQMKKHLSYTFYAFCAAIIFLFTDCSKVGNPVTYSTPATDTVFYKQSTEDFPNPERGFYRVAETYVNNYVPLDVEKMKTWRTLTQADDGNYKVYSTL